MPPRSTPTTVFARGVAMSALLAALSCGAPPEPHPAKDSATPALPITVSNGQLIAPTPLQFAGATSAELAPTSAATLEKVALWLSAHAEVTLLRVEGHCDGAGKAADAQALSERRALAVCKRLVELGVACERLLPVGFGARRPLTDNATVDGRAKNRRIELRPAALRGSPIGNRPVDGGGTVAGDPCAH